MKKNNHFSFSPKIRAASNSAIAGSKKKPNNSNLLIVSADAKLSEIASTMLFGVGGLPVPEQYKQMQSQHNSQFQGRESMRTISLGGAAGWTGVGGTAAGA